MSNTIRGIMLLKTTTKPIKLSNKVFTESLPITFIIIILCNKGQECILFVGTAAFDKLTSLLTNKLPLKDIGNLSPDAQTSCLEGFHATLNHWHPKMIGFSWLGTLCRYHTSFIICGIKYMYVINNIDMLSCKLF